MEEQCAMSGKPGPSIGPSTGGHEFRMDLRSKVYLWMSGISVASLLVSDVVGSKLFDVNIMGVTVQHTCGMIAFPVTFVITDLLNDYYGKAAARRVAIVSFTMALLAFVVINVALSMPRLDASFNVNEESFHDVFASARVMYIASLTAYIVGTFLDIRLFSAFKRLTGGKAVWLRATGSTVISQMIDSFIVSWLAFSLMRRLIPDSGTPASFVEVLKIAATGYTLKFFIALALTPIIYLAHGLLSAAGLRPVPVAEA